MNHRTTLAVRFAVAASFAVLGAGCSKDAPPPATAAAATTPSTAPLTGAAPTGNSTAPSAPSTTTPAPGSAFAVSPEARAIVDAADRDAKDRELDAGRKPAELLSFLALRPGMRVAELGAGGGYTTELLARAVGPSGVVYGQNSAGLLEKFAQKPWSERLAKPVDKNVVSMVREFDDPFTPAAKDLDAVVCVLFYHDTVWLKVDRDKMNAAVFRALKSGGEYVIVDHSGKPGTGTNETKSLHRIEESAVKSEIEKAGFKLTSEASFLREPSDTRDWSASPGSAGDKRGHSDRFVLKFVKP